MKCHVQSRILARVVQAKRSRLKKKKEEKGRKKKEEKRKNHGQITSLGVRAQ